LLLVNKSRVKFSVAASGNSTKTGNLSNDMIAGFNTDTEELIR